MKPLIEIFPEVLNATLTTLKLLSLSILNWINSWFSFCINEVKQNKTFNLFSYYYSLFSEGHHFCSNIYYLFWFAQIEYLRSNFLG